MKFKITILIFCAFLFLSACSIHNETKEVVEPINCSNQIVKCESIMDCSKNKFNCSFDCIDLSHQMEVISPQQAKKIGYNYYSSMCFEGICRCLGNSMTTH